jgi:1-deoxy-D-xylulose-5-phosphate synthase
MISNLKKLTPVKLKKFTIKELSKVAYDIRQFLIQTNSFTGGHIGANLATIELSIGLHYHFSSPKDVFIFDTGHTGYTHKIITGRANKFSTLNSFNGLNRFLSHHESKHDFLEMSHAGTSISIALGRAIAMRNLNINSWTIALIGDGALSEGIALEALNHAAVEKNLKLLIIINDNAYAISPGFGAIHNYLQSRRVNAKKKDTFFSSLGYNNYGPIDGHSIPSILETLKKATSSDRVSVIHAKTEKGKGLKVASNHPYKMHFSDPFDIKTGALKAKGVEFEYQDFAAMAIEDNMRKKENIVAITPSTLYATGLSKIFKLFPKRCFDPGMEEQHSVSLAVGLALSGMHPILFYQSTFLQRAFDQLIHDVSFSNQNILILTARSGFAGYDNSTHHGIYDFSYMRCLPNIKVFYPKDAQEIYNTVDFSLNKIKGPVIIHMPFGSPDIDKIIRKRPSNFNLEPEEIIDGKDGLIITTGNMINRCISAISLLNKQKLKIGLVNIRQIKPTPDNHLLKLVKNYKKIITVEESVLEGGFGSSISSFLHRKNLKHSLLQIGLPCSFIEPGLNSELSKKYKLDPKGIANQIFKFYKKLN